MIEKVNCKLLYLPPYSPDLNPIEKFWENFKRNIKKLIKKCGEIKAAITEAFNITLSG